MIASGHWPVLAALLALHILSVVFWIGGMGFVTVIVLPALTRLPPGRRFPAFQELERRFARVAQILVILTGASGGALIARLHLQPLLDRTAGLWLDGMIAFWSFFVLLLFVLEPLVLHRRLAAQAQRDEPRVLTRLGRAHVILLILAVVVIAAAVLGAEGAA